MTRISQAGFSAVEGLLLLVIAGIIGFTGWFVYHSRQMSNKDYAASSSTAPSYKKSNVAKPSTGLTGAYASWKTGTLQYEQISYDHPSDWKMVDQSFASDLKKGCVTPGSDQVFLTSPSKNTVYFRTGISCIGDGGASVIDNVPITTLGKSAYLDLENVPDLGGGVSTSIASSACLSATTSADAGVFFGASKNITDGSDTDPPVDQFCYYPYDLLYDAAAGDSAGMTASSMKTQPDFRAAVKIFESMKYTAE